MNYGLELEKLIASLTSKPTLLLHSCCAPCSSYCITYLKDFFDITILYYNPNIEPMTEYAKRKEEQIRLCNVMNIQILDCDYDNMLYHKVIKGYEKEPERGKRCLLCFHLRLSKTAQLASNNFDYFGTTLTVSPYKNSSIINQIGLELEQQYASKYLVSDFKKKEGYKKSIELSKQYDLYRQDFCGCIYSKRDDICE